MDMMFGKLTWDAIPFHEPVAMGGVMGMVIAGLAVLIGITYFKKWGYLYREWLTSVDHKRLGIMYIVLALVMLLRGFADALMMRTQQAIASGGSEGFLHPDHYNQVFTAHGVIMIFFMAMPFMVGLMNIVVPLQIGARDVAFPFVNSLSFWLTFAGAMLVNASLALGEFARTGWLAYPPLSELAYSPGVGVDYYIWALQISGLGTLLTGVNFFVTIVKMRAPGMTWMRLPIFTWTALCTNMLIILAFPILTVTLAMLGADRYLGMHFFTNDGGGNPMMYVNLIWAWGHPEVYILILPAFGVFSEITSTFCVQEAVRLHLDGLRHDRHHGAVVHGLAAPLLHDGLGRQRQRVLRHRHDADLHPDGREDLQLAVHDVPRPRAHDDADAVDDRLHHHLRDRRHDRRACWRCRAPTSCCTTACS